MKTWTIEVTKFRAMAQAHGTIRAQVDASVVPGAPRDGDAASLLTFDEATARVLVLLLKTQLADIDAKKPKSRRG